jgi:hypothetical protein
LFSVTAMARMGIISSARRRAIAIAIAALVVLASGCGGGGHEKARHSVATPPAPPPDVAGSNVVRIPGRSPADVAGAAALAVYSDRSHQPRGLVFTPHYDWRQAIVAAQFAAHPLDAAILPTAGDYLPPAPSDLVNRLTPSGFPRAKGLQALILGKAGDDVLSALQNRGLNLTQLKARTPAELTFKAVPFRGGWAHSYSDQVVIVSSTARDYALPGAAWSAYSGDTVGFVTHDSIPDATRELLVQRQKLRLEKPAMYVIGPRKVISDRVVAELARYGSVKRVAGDTPAATSIALARYKDPKTGFGWGLNSGPASISLLNTRDWGNAFGAFALASGGPQAPLLLTASSTAVPPEVVKYLRQLRNAKANQAFLLGDAASIGSAELAQVDRELAAR